MIRKFLAPVPGQGLIQLIREPLCLLDECGNDRLRVLVGHLRQRHVTRMTFDQSRDVAVFRSGQEIAFPEKPSSIVVGTFGRAGERFAVLTASGIRRPSVMNAIADEMPITQKSTRPAITSVRAASPPLNGTWVALTPAASRKRSAAQCVALPTPADPKVTVLSFARSTNSPAVLMPFDGATSITFGTAPNMATPAKSLDGS